MSLYILEAIFVQSQKLNPSFLRKEIRQVIQILLVERKRIESNILIELEVRNQRKLAKSIDQEAVLHNRHPLHPPPLRLPLVAPSNSCANIEVAAQVEDLTDLQSS